MLKTWEADPASLPFILYLNLILNLNLGTLRHHAENVGGLFGVLVFHNVFKFKSMSTMPSYGRHGRRIRRLCPLIITKSKCRT